jgi:peptidyl-prolyl cis-trans isomerase B (cyclophilin B)
MVRWQAALLGIVWVWLAAEPALGQEKATPREGKNPMVLLTTSMGEIKIELYPDKAPKTVENFLAYVKSGQYDGLVFHRVIPGFMIQGGGLDANLNEKKTERAPIQNEANNGLKNTVGTIAMARTSDPHSASAQFFINVKDNGFLDHRDETRQGWGYAVFGRVVEGMDVVRKIETVPTTTRPPHQNVPKDAVVIQSARVVE